MCPLLVAWSTGTRDCTSMRSFGLSVGSGREDVAALWLRRPLSARHGYPGKEKLLAVFKTEKTTPCVFQKSSRQCAQTNRLRAFSREDVGSGKEKPSYACSFALALQCVVREFRAGELLPGAGYAVESPGLYSRRDGANSHGRT